MAIFGPKPWVNPFGKISIFRLFLACCFYSLEMRICDKRFSWPKLPKIKRWINGQFLTKTKTME